MALSHLVAAVVLTHTVQDETFAHFLILEKYMVSHPIFSNFPNVRYEENFILLFSSMQAGTIDRSEENRTKNLPKKG
jgi:hypothetical protein